MNKKINIITVISAIIIVLAILAMLLPHNNPISNALKAFSIDTPFSHVGVKMLKKSPHTKIVFKKVESVNYNLTNMLALMESYRALERSFFSNFQNFIENKNNFEQLEITLNQFKKERKNFQRCFGRNKKRESIRYYFRIIEHNIDGLEEMIEKIKIHTGQVKAQLEKEKSTNFSVCSSLPQNNP